MVFFRNRLVMLSDENVIMSRPGNFFNFWAKTATTFSNVDPIDLSCSSTYPAIVFDAIQVNTGLVIFTKNQQFMLTTDSDILNPNTAKINRLASYNFNHKTNPVNLGTTIGFLDNANKYSRFFEMLNVRREGEPNILEQSKYIFPPINVNEDTVGIFWNNPKYKENIKLRTIEMINQGLVSEINNIKNPSKTILQAIGMNIDKDIEENINIKTMKLAKKQITWFKKEPRLKMIESEDESIIYESMMELINE